MNESPNESRPNGATWAAILASGIGGFAVGLIVILNEVGSFSAPTLYGPAGGVSGRTTLAVAVWVGAWVVLHRLWRDREVNGDRVIVVAAVLTLLGLVGTFPPVWSLL